MSLCSFPDDQFFVCQLPPRRSALRSRPSVPRLQAPHLIWPLFSKEAIRKFRLDEEEGADWVMVKPGLSYLDIVWTVRSATMLPVAVYQVSGEYAMLRAGSAAGAFQYEAVLIEALTAMRRAGADNIFTYGALDAASLLSRREHFPAHGKP